MIEITNLNFAYRASRQVFSDLNLSISRGGIYGLLGKNGAGKSTLFNLISGLLFADKESQIKVLDFNPKNRDVKFLEQVFILPEEFELPRTTVNEFAELYGKFYPNFSAEQMYHYLSELEVSPAEKFHQMSFGQRKKAYIAFALACNTDLLLLDEPTNGLDIPAKATFRRLMASIASDERTIIISTHQVRDLEEILDSVVVIDGSNILLNATTSDITRRLRFEVVTPDTPNLYMQPTIHGLLGVVENHDPSSETGLDMELLFNAVVSSPEKIKEIFSIDN